MSRRSGKKNDSTASRLLVSLLTGAFFLGGLVGLFFLLINPIYLHLASSTWTETPCTITSSKLHESRGDDGSSYKVEIQYDYEFEGISHTSDRYSFTNLKSNLGGKKKRAAVKSLPEGKATVCLVNPRNPEQAVLDSKLSIDIVFAILPLMFAGIGGLGLWSTLKTFASTPNVQGRNLPGGSATSPHLRSSPGMSDLKPEVGPIGSFIAISIFAIIWNGIISVPVFNIIEGFKNGKPEWLLTVFIGGLFVPIGLLLLVFMIKMFLALFNPRIKIQADVSHLTPGQTLFLKWQAVGWASRLKAISFVLEGTTRPGVGRTKRRGDTSIKKFAEIESTVFEAPEAVTEGNCEIVIPEDAKSSNEDSNPRVQWRLKVKGVIRFWPDIDIAFPVHILPQNDL